METSGFVMVVDMACGDDSSQRGYICLHFELLEYYHKAYFEEEALLRFSYWASQGKVYDLRSFY
jgi:hypothetical protein